MSIKTKTTKIHTVVYQSSDDVPNLTSFKTRESALKWADEVAKELNPVAQDHMELAEVSRGAHSLEIVQTDLVEYFEVPDEMADKP